MSRVDDRDIILYTLDTEASTTSDDRGTFAVMYSWDCVELLSDPSSVEVDTVEHVTRIHEGRTYESLYTFLDSLVRRSVDEGVQVKVAVHNLSYDYMFVRQWLRGFDDIDVVCRSSTRVLRIAVGPRDMPWVVFFDTLAIFGYSLRQLGENLGYSKTHIDYSAAIAPDTTLGESWVEYNRRDVYILMLGICRSLLTREGVTLQTLGRSILTKTGIVRVQDRESRRIGALRVSKRRTIYDEDRIVVRGHSFPDEESYLKWCSYSSTTHTEVKGCYAGGVNLSNAHYLGLVTHDVKSVDLKSAYPAIMVSYRIPTNPVHVSDVGRYSYLISSRQLPNPCDVIEGNVPFWRGTVCFTGLRVDPEWEARVGDTSVSLSMLAGHRENSGTCAFRDGYLHDASQATITMTSATFYEICAQYDFDSAEFLDLDVYVSHESPTRYTTLRTLHHYAEKSFVKRADATNCDDGYAAGFISWDEREALAAGDVSEGWKRDFVLRHKGNLNSLYGIMVTDPLHGTWYLGDDMLPCDIPARFGETDIRRDAMQWREAGVLIAVYNRYKLVWCVRKAVDLGYDVVYCDTDSIKFRGDWARLSEALGDFDRRTEARNVKVAVDLLNKLNTKADATGYDPFDTNISQDLRDLGKFDYEGEYMDFYTSGHKKYAYGDGKTWRARCSGYSTAVVDSALSWLVSKGLYGIAPNVALGYDTTYAASTGIATGACTIPGTWVDASMSALDATDGETVHEWHGMACPGNAIVPIPKVMNDSGASELNRQRREACERNEPRNSRIFGRTLARVDGEWMIGLGDDMEVFE